MSVAATRLRPHGIMFHHFRGGSHPRVQGSLTASELREMIGFLGPHRILSPQEWSDRARRGLLEDNQLCLTFDDSLRCQYEIARPVLDALGIRAFWFIYTSVLRGAQERLELYRYFRTTQFADIGTFYDAFLAEVVGIGVDLKANLQGFDSDSYLREFVFYTDGDRLFRYVRDEILGPPLYSKVMDKMLEASGLDLERVAASLWMDDDCVRQLHRDGHVIGLHSHTHPTRLAELDLKEQEEQYRLNAECLAVITGERPTSMSHPCNSYTSQTLSILRGLDIVLGFRANMESLEFGELEHPREDHTCVAAAMTKA